MKRSYLFQKQGYDFDKAVDRVAEVFSLNPEQVLISGKQLQRVKARSLLFCWAVIELAMN
jgi:hypothetical protein